MLGQVAGTCQSAGAAAHHRHLAARGVALALRFGLCTVVVGHETLQGANGDRLVLHTHHAAALALRLLRTHASADGRQCRVHADGDVCLVEVLFLDILYETRNVDAHGTGLHAARLLALQAAVGLRDGLALRQSEAHLVEVPCPHLGLLLGRLLSSRSQGLLHGRGQIARVAALRGGNAVAAGIRSLQLARRLVEVHQVAVELRTVHAAELHLVANPHAAGAAHTRAVHHHAVQAHDGRQVVLLRRQADELHHRQRPDGHAVAVFHALGAQLVHLGRHQALLAVAPVVRHDVQVVAHCAQLVLVEQQVLRAGADNHVGRYSLAERPFHLRKHRRDTHAAGHEEQPLEWLSGQVAEWLSGLCRFVTLRLPQGNQLAGSAQGAYDGVQVLALVHLCQLARRLAHHLEHNHYRLPLVDNVADGQRYALPLLVGNHNDELARLPAERYPRRVNLHPVYLVAVEQPLADNLVHIKNLITKH